MMKRTPSVTGLRLFGWCCVLIFTGCSTNPENQFGYMPSCREPPFETLGYVYIDGSFNGCSYDEEIRFSNGPSATCNDRIPGSIDRKVVLLKKTIQYDESYEHETNSRFSRVIQDSFCFKQDHSDICRFQKRISVLGDTSYSSQAKDFQEPIRLKRSFYTYEKHKIVESGGEETYDISFANVRDVGACIWEDANDEEFRTALPLD